MEIGCEVAISYTISEDVARLASRVAGECHAQPLLRVTQIADHSTNVPKAQNGSEKDTHALGAERRVATLAAHGDTNCEIARSLFITVSTVEQHLTRGLSQTQGARCQRPRYMAIQRPDCMKTPRQGFVSISLSLAARSCAGPRRRPA
jgi:DNA-binding NarL/FixJ family response regulator